MPLARSGGPSPVRFMSPAEIMDRASKLLLCSFQSMNTPPATTVRLRPSLVSSSKTITSLPGWSSGSGFSNTPLIPLKMAVFAPMPRASVSTDTAVKPGFFSSWRKANLRSFIEQRKSPLIGEMNVAAESCKSQCAVTGGAGERAGHPVVACPVQRERQPGVEAAAEALEVDRALHGVG